MTEAAAPLQTTQQHRYTAVAIFLHWTIAVLIIGMIFFGWYVGDLERSPERTALLALHKSTGITILLLSVARVVWRLMNKPPAEPPMPAWQGGLATFVHVGFYALIILMPLTGWLYSSLAVPGQTKLWGLPWFDVPGAEQLAGAVESDLVENVHSKLAWVTIVLLGLHLAGALKHQFVDKDGLIARMAPGLFGATAGPRAPGRGLIYTGGAVLLLAAAGLVLGNMNAGPAATPPPGAEQAQQAPAGTTAPQWQVDAAKSTIAFRFTYKDNPFDGTFKGWTADIRFDPAKPEISRIHVSIPMAQLDAGEADFTDTLKDRYWFDTRRHATATFDVTEDGGVIKTGDNAYEASGVLTIKGVTFPLRLPFTLSIAGSTATMHAEVPLKRVGLMLGDGMATTGGPNVSDWVGDEVRVTVDVVATRQ